MTLRMGEVGFTSQSKKVDALADDIIVVYNRALELVLIWPFFFTIIIGPEWLYAWRFSVDLLPVSYCLARKKEMPDHPIYNQIQTNMYLDTDLTHFYIEASLLVYYCIHRCLIARSGLFIIALIDKE